MNDQKTSRKENTIKFKVVDEKMLGNIYENCDYGTLEDDFEYKLEEYNLPKDVTENLVHSLSHCQGGGVEFHGGSFSRNEAKKLLGKEIDLRKIDYDVFFQIKRNSNSYHYCHSDTFYVEEEAGRLSILNDKNFEYYEEISKKIEEKLKQICKELEKFGYDCIESIERDNLFYYAFEKFKKINNIDNDRSYFDFNYTENKELAESEGYVLIAELDYCNLYMELPKLEKMIR
jgi:hypothetical protein